MKVFTLEEIKKALDIHYIGYSIVDRDFVIKKKFTLSEGMKVVRIQRAHGHIPIQFGQTYTIKKSYNDEARIEIMELPNKFDNHRFIPLNVLQYKRNHFPKWF